MLRAFLPGSESCLTAVWPKLLTEAEVLSHSCQPFEGNKQGEVAAAGGFVPVKNILIWHLLVTVSSALLFVGYCNPSPCFAERTGQSSVLEELLVPEHRCRKMPHGAQQGPAWPGWSQAHLKSPDTAVGCARAREGPCPSALPALPSHRPQQILLSRQEHLCDLSQPARILESLS